MITSASGRRVEREGGEGREGGGVGSRKGRGNFPRAPQCSPSLGHTHYQTRVTTPSFHISQTQRPKIHLLITCGRPHHTPLTLTLLHSDSHAATLTRPSRHSRHPSRASAASLLPTLHSSSAPARTPHIPLNNLSTPFLPQDHVGTAHGSPASVFTRTSCSAGPASLVA